MDAYFNNLNKELKNYQRAVPCLLVDLDILDKNITTLQSNLRSDAELRIVVKSLPSLDLIKYVLQKTNTHKLMVFHQPFLTHLSSELDHQKDILLGKPMPIKTAHFFYQNLPQHHHGFNPFTQIQWLVDTKKRIQEYINLAKQLQQKIRLNIEIDVGLHRGGFNSIDSLKEGLELIKEHQDYVEFSGFMGYDPHVVKLPKIILSEKKALQKANTFYEQCKQLVEQKFSSLWKEDLTFNGAGSPTLNLHKTKKSPINDIAIGSCLVKPSTFDIPSLKDFTAAAFIATPVLKKFKNTTIPGIEKYKWFLNILNSINKQSYFIYGGYWKADYYYPEGIKENNLFGKSTNQTMINAPIKTALNVDDFVFLKPQQSEFVFLQFGEILPIKNGKILTPWYLLKNN
ncbi:MULTISPECIES: alanine racemase [unclassified Tenacibaculum]|uniref:alanine racemase n=1 Tax=unclassified Tenacibaculum TaxID=2635139 RepID=UPI001F3A9A84|nr:MULTISPECIES: alanine racemase [unclassified Tenacibaculum]MCF2874851.1 alanine racemase [Tenacibaculum sp. Cn5-1]MCF2934083.1 alanine racemase [Tenacibaculum sp. Cn5-34]MCG7510293.1 alanine racemase [Tenacibaculum sp. Cn5-46]